MLGWVNLAGRDKLSGGHKLAWAIFLIFPIVPFIYVLTGGDLCELRNRTTILPAYAARSGASSALATSIVPNFVSSDSPSSGRRGISMSSTSVHPGPSMVTMNRAMSA